MVRSFTSASNQPLTLDRIRELAPSAFAPAPYHAMSSRYAYIPTSEVIKGMISAGFQPFAASQSRAKVEDKREHTKHMVRFRSMDTKLSVGQTFPEIVLVNSHDGSTAYKLMAGLFRLVCSNGMIVADSAVESVSVRHSGNVVEAVTAGSVEIVEHMPRVIDAVARWQEIQLSQAEQSAFAEAAHVVRFADVDGRLHTPIQPSQLLQPRRVADTRSDLWSVFNRVQENVIRGGLRGYRAGDVRRVTTRPVKGIDQDVKLNRALWVLAERMAELKQ